MEASTATSHPEGQYGSRLGNDISFPNRILHHRHISRALVAICALILVLWTAFVITRVPLLSHFQRIAGDTLDGELALGIEMHWSHVLNGTAINWRTTDYFFPVRDTLGYNEGFFLNGIFLALLRRLGADPFLAMQLVDWCLRAIGFASMWALTRRYFGWPSVINFLAAALFVTANCYYPHQAGHAQLLNCNWLPLLLLFQIESFQAARSGAFRRFIAYSACFAILIGAVSLSSFYVIFFFILTDLTALALLTSLSLVHRRIALSRALKSYIPYAATQLVFVFICCIPCLVIYLPKAAETGMHRFDDILAYSLKPTDVVNVGPWNVFWSHVYDQTLALFLPNWQGGFENQTGATPILFALFLCAGWSLRRSWKGSWSQTAFLAMWCANLLLLALTIHWPHWFWAWGHIYRFIPGAAAIRVISRIQLVLLVTTIVLACNQLALIWRRPGLRPVCIGLGCLLLIEQLNDAPVFLISRPAERAFFAAMDHVPPHCRVFFAENSRPGPDYQSLYRHNVDAMILAEMSGTPTINGFATFLPPYWNLVHPESPQYLPAVRNWLISHAVAGPVCGINFQTGTWSVYQSPRLVAPSGS
jgi:hypothetical protein